MMLNCIWRWNHPLPLPDHYQRNIIAFSNNSGPHCKQRQPVKSVFFLSKIPKVYKRSNPGLGSLSIFLHISSSIDAVKSINLNDVDVLSVSTTLNRSNANFSQNSGVQFFCFNTKMSADGWDEELGASFSSTRCPVSDGGFLKTCSQSQHKKNLLVKSAQGKTNLFLFGKLQ